jgi:drug/metabolite transporter (DMT)-like permease
MSQQSSHLKAIIIALTGFTAWTISDMFLKLIGESTLPKYELMMMSSIGGMVIIFTSTALRGDIKKLKPRKWKGLLILGLLHLTNFFCWFMAIQHLQLTSMYTVTFMCPMIIAILAAIFLSEKFSWKHGLAILIGFAGVTYAVNPTQLFGAGGHWRGYIYVFCAAILMSVMMVILRILGPRENREATAFYPRVVIFIGTMTCALIMGFHPMSFKISCLAFSSGMVGSLGWLLMAHAYKLAPAATVAPFQYSQIVSGALVGYLVWHDVPNYHTLIGAVIIIASGIYIITHARKSALVLKGETHEP